MIIKIPQYIIKNSFINGNNIFQLGFKGLNEEVELDECEDGYLLKTILDEDILITNQNRRFKNYKYILKYKDSELNERTELKWFRYVQDESIQEIKEMYESNYKIKKEIVENDNIIRIGLRTPQVGAIHAILSNITNPKYKEGIVVMPTGTGKTEVMLTTFLSEEIKRLIVITPSNALREQIGNKFKQLGILRKLGIINRNCKYPVVGILKKGFKSKEEEAEFFKQCNVVITSMQLAINLDTKNMNNNFSHLFIDEAHHITLNKWGDIANKFKNKIVQFTATPFRNDGKMLKGDIIYKYSLLQAQEEKYFKAINFEPVMQFDEQKADETIAKKTVEVLKKDIEDGLEHVAMARVESIRRAEQVSEIYNQIAPEFKPLMINNEMNKNKKNEILEKLYKGDCKIIICVNMLGEGFDFPRLKIAAIHDPHKSIATTIQFVGRFTRTSNNKIGDATIIANISNEMTNKAMEELYSQDSDWNKIIRQTSDVLVDKEDRKIKFLQNFEGEIPEIVPLQNIYPALSMYTFKTKYQNFLIDRAIEKIKNDNIIISQNYEENMLACIEKHVGKTDWCRNEDIREVVFDLYIIYFDKDKKIIYIGTTTKNPPTEILNKCFEDAEPINGENTFKCLYNIQRLKLSTLGLNANNSGYVSYRMYAGRDVIEGISDPNKLNSYKNNLFGKGYENQDETSIGCSKKGKIWSKKIGNLLEWKEWCDRVGEKICNPDIKVEEIIKDIPVPQDIEKLPNKVPICIEFQPDILIDNESRYIIRCGDKTAELTEVDIKLSDDIENGKIKFVIESEENGINEKFEMKIINKKTIYSKEGKTVEIKTGYSYKELTEWFGLYPPKITYADGSTLENTYYLEATTKGIPKFNKEDIIVYNWDKIDIRKESQGIEKENDTIQYKVINTIKSNRYDLIFDDDGSGEISDIIAIKVDSEIINIDLFHCKYSKEDLPGARIGDLYEVCGQAQKSINWKIKPERLLKHILRRENLRENKHNGASRFEIGDKNTVNSLINMSRVYSTKMNIYIVQPGVSKNKVTDAQLELLGVTKTWLFDTLGIKLYLIASK